MYWLGIDIGTGGTRALLVDERGAVKGSYTAAHEDMRMERPLWAEQRPENWWDAAQEAIRGVLREASASADRSRGIGLSGQMHGLTLLDAEDEVIRPALIWCDQRSQAQVDHVNTTVGRDNVLACTANPVVTGFTLPKLLWVRDNEPQQLRASPQGSAAERLRPLQTHGRICDRGLGCFRHVALRCRQPKRGHTRCATRSGSTEHPPEVLRIGRSQRPTSSGAVASSLGLKAGTPVVGGGGDQAASAVGNGIVEAGIVSCTLGTSGVVFAHMDQPHYDPEGPSSHLLPRRSRQMACDGRHAGRRTQPAMDAQPTHAG